METRIRSAAQMVKMFSEDTALLTRLKTDPNPLEVLQETATKAEIKIPAYVYVNDIVLYRIAVTVLGSLALLAAIGSLILAFAGMTTPRPSLP